MKIRTNGITFDRFFQGGTFIDVDASAEDIINENDDTEFLEAIGKDRAIEYWGLKEAE